MRSFTKRVLSRFFESTWALLPVLAFALGCLLFQLTEAPPTWYDEGMIVQLALNLASNGQIGTQVAPGVLVSGAYTSSGLPIIAPVAASFLMVGHSLFAARVVMVLFTLLLIGFAYFFVRRIAGPYAALSTAALLATFSSLYGDGKNVLGEVPGLVFLVLFLVYASKLIDEGSWFRSNALLAGLFLGLCIITKPTFLLLFGAAGIAFLYIAWRDRKFLPFRLLAWGALGVLVPFVAWLTTQFSPDDSLTRILSFYGNPYRLTDLSSVMFHNAMRFFTETTPLFLAGILGLWGISAVLRARSGIRIMYAELTAFLFCLFVLAAYLRTPGWYRYLFPAQIVATLYLPLALSRLALARVWNAPVERTRLFSGIVILLLVGIQTYVLFFDSWIHAYAHSTNTKQMEAYFGAQSATTTWLVYDAPEAVLFLPAGAEYYQYIAVNAAGYWAIGEEERALIGTRGVDRIVASEREDATTFPGYTESARPGKLVIFERKSAR